MPTRIFIWDTVDDCVLQEKDETGATLVTYTHEQGPFGPLVSQERNGKTSYHHFDALGSTRLLTDDNQDITDTYLFDAWGNAVATTGTTENSYRWVGRWGYQYATLIAGYYVRARPYKPLIARWNAADPIRFVDGINLYIYAFTSPTLQSDPSGMLAVKATSLVAPGKCGLTSDGEVPFCEAAFQFTLDGPANVTNWNGYPFAGYFVQKVILYCEVRECNTLLNGCPIKTTDLTKTTTYFEAFEVDANEKTYIVKPTDQIREPVFPDTCGNSIQLGEVRFFSIDDTQRLDKDSGWDGNAVFEIGPFCTVWSGGIPATTKEPTWWTNNKQKEGPVARYTSLNYDCCCGSDTITFRGFPELS